MSPGSNKARKLRATDVCAGVLYPWGQIACRHSSVFVAWSKIFHRCLCYIFNHVDVGTSWSFGVLEYNHVNRVHYFEYFCPGTPCLIRYLLYRFYNDYHKLLSLLYASQVYFFNSCYWSWARCQIFLCLERHTNEAKGSIQCRIDPFASFACQTADNFNKSYYGSKNFRPLELKGVNRQQKQVVPSWWPATPTCVVWSWDFNKGVLCTCLDSKGQTT